MAINPPADLPMTPLHGPTRSVSELLTTFDLCFVALDPFTNESAWILETAARILSNFDQADVRVALLCTGTIEECRLFLGPHVQRHLTFADPDRQIVKAFGLERLPAIVHLGITGDLVASCEGWDPSCWRSLTDNLARRMAWSGPSFPIPGDPGPFPGTAATVPG